MLDHFLEYSTSRSDGSVGAIISRRLGPRTSCRTVVELVLVSQRFHPEAPFRLIWPILERSGEGKLRPMTTDLGRVGRHRPGSTTFCRPQLTHFKCVAIISPVKIWIVMSRREPLAVEHSASAAPRSEITNIFSRDILRPPPPGISGQFLWRDGRP